MNRQPLKREGESDWQTSVRLSLWVLGAQLAVIIVLLLDQRA